MPNDAKLGLVVGVGLTIAVAVVFFSKDPNSPPSEPQGRAPVSAQVPSPDGVGPRPLQGQTTGRPSGSGNLALIAPRSHVIAPGETLYTIAQHYYGRGDRFTELYRANQKLIPDPDRLPVGQTIIIP